jgi:hypothetical protein
MKLLTPGTVLDGFEIRECVHAGGMAHIYLVDYAAADDGSRRASEFAMAMKIPRMTAGDGAENIISFEVEHQILPSLTGRHVPHFVAAGDLSRTPYLVMEYVQGQTLQHWLDQPVLPAPEQVALLGGALARAALVKATKPRTTLPTARKGCGRNWSSIALAKSSRSRLSVKRAVLLMFMMTSCAC